MARITEHQVVLDKLLQEFVTMCGHYPVGVNKKEIDEAVYDILDGRKYEWVHNGEVVKLRWLKGWNESQEDLEENQDDG